MFPGHRESHIFSDADTVTAFSKITCDVHFLQFDLFLTFQEGENGYPPLHTCGPQKVRVNIPATLPSPFAVHPGGFNQNS